MATILAGKYKFIDNPDTSGGVGFNLTFTTKASDKTYYAIQTYADTDKLRFLSQGESGNLTALDVYIGGVWQNEEARVITVPKDFETIDAGSTWFSANTEEYVEPEEPEYPETPTADSLKAKIQSLIAKANTTTGKSDTDLTSGVISLIAGYGQGSGSGECSGNHVIPVDELPTENIGTEDIYDVAFVFTDVVLVFAAYDMVISYKEQITAEGGTFECYTIPTRTTENVKISTDNAIYCYYIQDENVISTYGETETGSGVYEWVDLEEAGMTFNGFVSDISQATADGVYGIGGGGYYKYYEGPFLTDVIAGGTSGVASGEIGEMFYVETRPTFNLVVSDAKLNPYYIEDENDIFIYDGTEFYSASELLNMTFGGAIYDISEATDTTKYYALISEGGFQRLYPESAIGSLNAPTTEEKTVTPTKSTQEIVPTNADYLSKVTVNPIPSSYIQPSGTVILTANGTHNVSSYSSAKVEVPIPDGYIKPSGKLAITANGERDVTNYASVEVNVPSIPSHATEEEMTAFLESAEVGLLAKYTGESTDTYESGALYIVEAVIE